MSIFYYNSETGDRRSPGVGQVEAEGRIYVQPNHDTLLTLGYVQVVTEPRPDDRFYSVTGPANDGTYTATPKNLDDLKASYLEKQDAVAGSVLSQTDWYVVRELETGTAIPANVATYRALIRGINNANEALISAAGSVDALKALVDAPEEVVEDPTAEVSVMVENSEPHLTSYPALEEE